ncbi:MAG: hypothetical protein ACK45U_04375, partial [bacterium]
MKKSIILLFSASVLLISNIANAQTKQVAEEIIVDGFKVIYKPTSNQIVSARLVIKGGTTNYTKELEGVENLMLNIATS